MKQYRIVTSTKATQEYMWIHVQHVVGIQRFDCSQVCYCIQQNESVRASTCLQEHVLAELLSGWSLHCALITYHSLAELTLECSPLGSSGAHHTRRLPRYHALPAIPSPYNRPYQSVRTEPCPITWQWRTHDVAGGVERWCGSRLCS